MDREAAQPENEEEFYNEDSASESSRAESERDTDLSDGWAQLPASTQQIRDQLDAVSDKHAKKGDQAGQSREWQTAVHEYTSALKCCRDPQQEANLLSKRSKALCNMAKHIRAIPARMSERRALYGHDPTHLAQLALKDAEKALQTKPTDSELYVYQGTALFLLECYTDAESAYLEGLALQPEDKNLQDGLKQVQEMLAEQDREQQQQQAEVRHAAAAAAAAAAPVGRCTAGPDGSSSAAAAAAGDGGGGAGDSSSPFQAYAAGGVRSSGGDHATAAAAAAAAGGSAPKRQRRITLTSSVSGDRDDCECILCLKLLFEPVTTPCGHTFCKGCFARSMDHSNKCPMCRTVLHVSRELPVTITLQNILSKAYPAEYAARAAEVAAAAAAGAAAATSGGAEHLTLPLFVMSTLLPGEKMALNIFEPRYRLMVRRCMEGSRKLGMAQVGRTGPDGLDQIAMEAEITECQLQPDGRYYLELVGRRRIKITDCWDLDGYRVASADVLKDATAPSSNTGSGSAAAAAEAPAGDNDSPTAAAGQGGRGGGEGQQLPELVDTVVARCDLLMARLRSVMTARRVGPSQIRELFDRLGDCPPKSDAEAISWWASRLLLMIVPSNSESWLRRELITLTDTAARLQYLQNKLDGRLEGAGIAACTIM